VIYTQGATKYGRQPGQRAGGDNRGHSAGANMGRGLSELQRYILAEAGTKRRLYYTEVLVGYFKWVARHPVVFHVADLPGTECKKGEMCSPGDQYFSRRQIGEPVYRKTMTTLSRACGRLEARGLVRCLVGSRSHWSGVETTEAGRDWLSANSEPNRLRVNQ
jgi:hypothetical protein